MTLRTRTKPGARSIHVQRSRARGSFAQSRVLTWFAAMALFIALAVPVQLAAQERKEEQRRYKLIDLGTFGGPNSFVNGPGTADLSNQGTYVGEAETSIPDPFAPKCLVPECLVQHAQKWRDGVVTDLGALSGINNSSGATRISANG